MPSVMGWVRVDASQQGTAEAVFARKSSGRDHSAGGDLGTAFRVIDAGFPTAHYERRRAGKPTAPSILVVLGSLDADFAAHFGFDEVVDIAFLRSLNSALRRARRR